MGVTHDLPNILVGPVNLRAQLSSPLFSPLVPQNPPVFPLIHTSTTSMSLFIQ